MSVWNRPAADRVVALREHAAATGQPLDGLSDLDVLNAEYEAVLRERIGLRDRYQGLLTGRRRHEEAVRAAAARTAADQADHYARYAVARYVGQYSALLNRIQQLSDRPVPRQVQGLRAAAESLRTQLRYTDQHPERVVEPDGAGHALRTLRHVVGVLDEREGLDGDEVLQLIKDTLAGWPPISVYDVADRGTPKPVPPPPDPPFAGPGWSDLGGLWAYQPQDTGAHVKAYPVGDDWYVDLYSADGILLAYGTAPATDIADLAPALTARADAWARDRTDYAWRRFTTTAHAIHHAADHPAPASGAPSPPAPGDARARAATATSPARPPGTPTTGPTPAPAAARPEPGASTRRSR
ncbi:hypothetical protein RKE29_01475 [Streptomyces sp. B1866]|uniref:hypothetical protein n=1 Tax=Streptomyces sp. B1866 TaxID=3075431 RepID=UPI00288DD980|nr:hypothetical protein [Streptomyces sp. B1866]MDT3395330.1 hypothetical protein [Streptomyces sp. B1866]